MGVPVRWLLNQPELGLHLRAGAAGTTAEITFAVTTELTSPGRWLSGGELVLTTGIVLPLDAQGRRAYMREFAECGAAAIGFGLGLSHDAVPDEMVDEAEKLGLTLFEVPLPTPFVAVVKTVMDRLAEQQYESVLAVSRAQPRMTRAAVGGGVGSTIRELSAACGGPVLLLDRAAHVIERSPSSIPDDVRSAVVELVTTQLRTGGVPDSSVIPGPTGVIVVQSIRVGRRTHGYLAVVFSSDPRPVDQVLIGHANSLLALDFEKPLRLHAEQNRINTGALQILLSRGTDLSLAREVVESAADEHSRIKVLMLLGSGDLVTVAEAIDEQLNSAGRPAFLLPAGDGSSLLALLRGTDDLAFAARLFDAVPTGIRRRFRIGLSTPHDVGDIEAAVEQARMTAASTDRSGVPEEAAALVGRTLLALPESRRVLDNLAGILVDPLAAYDSANNTELLPSLRAYLEANGQWEAAAAALGVHRHTLRSRIGRAEEVLSCDLSSARVRAELLLAIIARG
ncbi:PucR family transcriptional regulator [Gordonia sp. TBRC 11910]|uniref:PucR family transcriptional regulator n=1 Tax=Gordonia asplenii TaxID=2725283 RepID=A0A848L6F4_9ACTN|nr:PucR family transcriptional regulator [Gordonia asplenii]NMO04263.1 PucR family transcriptional regulator [Gordonia asplenii]